MFSLSVIRQTLFGYRPVLFHPKNRSHAAVALILREGKAGPEILFIVRAKRDGDPWSGDLGFPGGRVEACDKEPRLTAERETLEEIGLDLTEGRYSASVLVAGGGVSGQVGAIRHGIARALLSAHPDARAALREAGLLTRDPRAKERKKYGLKRARKAPQYTKR